MTSRPAPLSLGYSPCPNDTFIFCHLVEELQRQQEPYFLDPVLEDVETLNLWALEGRLDVTKLSFHAVACLLDSYCVLSAGSALGRGCGPLLVGRKEKDSTELSKKRIAIPGQYTTAALLFKMFSPQATDLVEMRFERIIEAVATGAVDAGVIIHESRFTYRQFGLVCLQDLGQWWETSFDLPIPLGCIAARKSLGDVVIGEAERRIKESLERARSDPTRCYPYIKQYAQETDDTVIDQHIGLYVNDFSIDLGEEGRQAVVAFIEEGRKRDILPHHQGSIFCRG
ncbi:MAG: 1,4-dihydroxy-6-naphthoate synthase [Desulfofustis sp.]